MPAAEIAHEQASAPGPSRGRRITRKALSWLQIAFGIYDILLGVLKYAFATLVAIPLWTLVFIAESRRLRRKPDEYTLIDERLRLFNLLIVRAYLYMMIARAGPQVGMALFVIWAIAKLFGFLSWFDDDEDLEKLRLGAESTGAPLPTSIPSDEALIRTNPSDGWKVVRVILSMIHFLTAINILVFSVFTLFDSSRFYLGTIYAQLFSILVIIAETRRFRRPEADGPRHPRAVAFDDLVVRGVLYQLAAVILLTAEKRMSHYNQTVLIAGYVTWGIGMFFCVLCVVAKLAGFLPRLKEEEAEGTIRLEESDEPVTA